MTPMCRAAVVLRRT